MLLCRNYKEIKIDQNLNAVEVITLYDAVGKFPIYIYFILFLKQNNYLKLIKIK